MHLLIVGGFLGSGKTSDITTACAVLLKKEMMAGVLITVRNECISTIPEMNTSALKPGLLEPNHHTTDVL